MFIIDSLVRIVRTSGKRAAEVIEAWREQANKKDAKNGEEDPELKQNFLAFLENISEEMQREGEKKTS